MNSAAKKVSLGIIVALFGVIVYLVYGKLAPVRAPLLATTAATSTTASTSQSLVADRLTEMVVERLAEGTTLAELDATKIVGIYQVGNLTLSAQADETALRLYGRQLAQILAGLTATRAEAGSLVLKAVERSDSNLAFRLTQEKKAGDQLIGDLLRLTVPQTAATIHLSLLNTLYADNLLLDNMSLALTEPRLALESAALHDQKTYPALLRSINEINQFFRQKNILFSATESQEIFTNP